MKQGFLVAGVCLLLVGCAKRPAELQRAEKLDAECGGKGVAFSYKIGSSIMDRGAKAGCYAPIGAWTEESDATKGGTRKLIYDMRETEKLTVVCCKP